MRSVGMFPSLRWSCRCLLLLLLGSLACSGGGEPWRMDAQTPPVVDGADAQTGGVGATCSVLTDAGPSQGVYNSEALECPSRICLKPPVQPGAPEPASTGGFCSALCTQDSDCQGQTRDPSDPLDARCLTGFLCGVAFVKGRICCQKLCLCKDFLGPAGAPTPIDCQGEDATTTCHEQP